jgi:hypothetical protein
VHAPFPVDEQYDLTRLFIDVHYDLAD